VLTIRAVSNGQGYSARYLEHSTITPKGSASLASGSVFPAIDDPSGVDLLEVLMNSIDPLLLAGGFRAAAWESSCGIKMDEVLIV
jgi:hypothetical protein